MSLRGRQKGIWKKMLPFFFSTELPSTVFTGDILEVVIIWETQVFVTN